MSINGNYSQPVTVNGFACWNCTDVSNAKKHIDPQHPRSGPYGIDAASDPTAKRDTAVTFGGTLAPPPDGAQDAPARGPGAALDITA
jgi:hypothetical protein